MAKIKDGKVVVTQEVELDAEELSRRRYRLVEQKKVLRRRISSAKEGLQKVKAELAEVRAMIKQLRDEGKVETPLVPKELREMGGPETELDAETRADLEAEEETEDL